MSAITYTHCHGRCRPCGVVYRWKLPGPKLREAHCPTCGRGLARTAAALVTSVPVVDVVQAADVRALYGQPAKRST